MKLGINGFGRIGRTILRAYFEHKYNFVNEFIINSTLTMEDSIHLLQYDSTFGKIQLDINKIEDNSCKINGKKFTFLSNKNPELLDWQSADGILECTGKFLTSESCQVHLKKGAKFIIMSAPAKDNETKTIVCGVNDEDFANDKIISIGSCTTNCLAPAVKVLHEKFHINSGFATTIHAYTSDQNLLDNSHKDMRRARSAAMSIIPTSSGVSKALAKVLPDLKGKIDGSALRVPVNNVSVIDLVVNFDKKITIDDINQSFIDASHTDEKGIIAINAKPLVSCDFIGEFASCVVDTLETRVIGEKCARILLWYDNEWGFSCRMLDVVKDYFSDKK